jgi:FixJ family two-component response regulator
MSKPTVYIIDDDPSARKGLTRLVKTAGFNGESFESANDFLASDKFQGPGCVLLDVQMPKMTGPELQEELSRSEYCMPIIFLSAHGDVPTTAKVMKRGAVDFLTKPVDRDELLWAIRVSLAKDKEDRMKMEENLSINDHIKSLTPREYEIMTYVITGMLNKQIAAELFISEETVKIHRGRMMHKLEIVSVAELVHHCETVGIAPAKTKSRKL